MLIDFLLHLRQHELPVTLGELLDLLAALDKQVIEQNTEQFYYLSRAILIKNETHYDKFDKAFASYFSTVESLEDLKQVLPKEWLRKITEKYLSEEEKKKIKSLGGFDKLLKTLQERLKEQKERHQGGNRWIGTGGTSSFGAYGYNPEGIRIGQDQSRHRRAVKVWDERVFRDLDGKETLGFRNIKVALKQLRQWGLEGAADVLDMDNTIKSTAKKAGLLDVKMLPEKRNKVKVLLFFDIGGSMDDHIKLCEQLFSAAKSEFKYLDYFYFHNCIYEQVWQNNQRRHQESISVTQLLRRYGNDYKVIFVGDASMSPYEILYPGGSVEHMNEESGQIWLTRIAKYFKKVAWLNPLEQKHWHYTPSIALINNCVEQQMFEMTIDGIGDMVKALRS